MKLAKAYFSSLFQQIYGDLLFVLKYMYISLLLKMINGFSCPAKIMVSPFKGGGCRMPGFQTLVLLPN